MLTPPKLFKNKKEFAIVSIFLIAIIAIRLFLYYLDYKELKNLKGYYYTQAQVLNLYDTKNDSTLLKLKDIKNLTFYLFTNKIPPNRFDWVRVKLKLKQDSTFWDYLKGFFAYGDIISKIEEGFDAKKYFRTLIDKQHKHF
jgi:hypothetical protein